MGESGDDRGRGGGRRVGAGWGGGDGKRAIERGTAFAVHGIKIEIKLRNRRWITLSLISPYRNLGWGDSFGERGGLGEGASTSI